MKPSRRFCRVRLLALLVGMTLLSTPLASASLTTDPPGKNPKNDTGLAAAAAVTTASAFSAAVISNGTVELGVNPEGHLDGGGVGDLFVPTGGDALIPGCLCEGWGLADLSSSVSGWASVDDGGISNVSVSRFDTTPSTAVSEVTIGSTFDVTQDYHPSSSANLYEDVVTVKNISAAPVTPRYRRVMDWDVPPTEFDEYVTVAGSSPALAFSSDDGFASSDPLSGPSSIIATGTFTDSGPTDHGALFDFDLGSLAPDESTSFVIYYGAAASQADASSALSGVGAEVYSIGKPNTPDGLANGSPNTFAFGFIRNPGPTDVVVDPDGQTVTGGGASTTIGELPFGNTVERDLSGPGSTPLTFNVVLGPNDQLKQLADGSVEVQRNPTDWDAPAQAAAVPDTSAVPDVSDDELSSVITAAPTAALEDTDADSPPMPSGGNDVDPVYEGGDSAATDPDGMSLVEDAADATGDEVAAVLGVPQVTDANGNSVPASLAIDSATSHVTVQVGAGAAYPVHVKVLVGFNLLLEPGTASVHSSYKATGAASASPSRAGVASASTTAATSCPNMGRTIIWDPNGSFNLEPALDAYPASCMHYFIIQQGLASNKKKFDLSRASKIRANSNAPRVQAAGSKFHAVASFGTGACLVPGTNCQGWDIDTLKGGSVANQQKDLKTVCRNAIAFRKTMKKKYTPPSGIPEIDFQVSSDPAVQGDTWAIDEAKHTSPSGGPETSILNTTWGRQKLLQLVTCLSNGLSGSGGYPAAKGIVFMSVRWPDQLNVTPGYKSGWESLLQNPSVFIWTGSGSVNSMTWKSVPFWQTIRPRILAWSQEVYEFCDDVCTAPGSSLADMATHANWYLQHPARLAFAANSQASDEARLTLWQKYLPLENAFYKDSAYHTQLDLKTMIRFVRLQTYATRKWATAPANGRYPFRRIGFAWNNSASQPQLARELAHSIQGAYKLNGEALFACTSVTKPTVTNQPNIGLCKPHKNGATLKPDWNVFGSW